MAGPHRDLIPHVDDKGRVWWVRVTWGTVNGRKEPVRVDFQAPAGVAVTADILRAIPIGTMIKAARRSHVESLAGHADALTKRGRADEATAYEELADEYGAQSGVALSGESLRALANVYREAWGRGDPVTKAVADAFKISKSSAGKRIMLARKRGFLGETGTRGGEAVKTRKGKK